MTLKPSEVLYTKSTVEKLIAEIDQEMLDYYAEKEVVAFIYYTDNVSQHIIDLAIEEYRKAGWHVEQETPPAQDGTKKHPTVKLTFVPEPVEPALDLSKIFPPEPEKPNWWWDWYEQPSDLRPPWTITVKPYTIRYDWQGDTKTNFDDDRFDPPIKPLR